MIKYFKRHIASSKLLLILTSILIILSIVCFILASPISPKEFFLNLGIEFLVIIFTIWFINRVLSEQEKMKWKGSRKIVSNKIFQFTNRVLSSIAKMLDIEKELFLNNDQNDPLDVNNYFSVQLINNIKNLDEDLIFESLFLLDHQLLVKFPLELNQITEEISSVLSFGNNFFDSSDYELILNYRDEITKISNDILVLHPINNIVNSNNSKPSKSLLNLRYFLLLHLGFDILNLLHLTITVSTKFFIPDNMTSALYKDEYHKRIYQKYQKFKTKDLQD